MTTSEKFELEKEAESYALTQFRHMDEVTKELMIRDFKAGFLKALELVEARLVDKDGARFYYEDLRDFIKHLKGDRGEG